MQNHPPMLIELMNNVQIINQRDGDNDNVVLVKENRKNAVRFIENFIKINITSKIDEFSTTHSLKDQIAFLQALTRNDKESLLTVLSQMVFDHEIKSGLISMNDVISIVNKIPDYQEIRCVTNNDEKSNIVSFILQNNLALAASPQEKEDIVVKIMRSIPDTFIDLSSKIIICKQTNPELNLNRIEISYNEPVSLLKESKSSGEVTLNEFIEITKNNKIDKSQYILLSLGLIKKFAVSNPEIKNIVNKINKLYTDTEYESAINNIKELCRNYENIMGKETVDKIILVGNQYPQEATPNNYSRRFFENRLAALYQGNTNDFTSINNVADFYFNSHKAVTTQSEAMFTLWHLEGLYYENKEISNIMQELQKESSLWSNRGRMVKEGFVGAEAEQSGSRSDRILSRNTGVMQSNQPNFPDELSQQFISNNQADINITDMKNPLSYALIRPRGAAVASISGHTYYMAALLEIYVKNNPRNKDELQNDVNNMIKAIACDYIRSGFHSLQEVVDVFNEDHIKNRFESYGIKIDLAWPQDILNEVFNDAQTYNKQINLKQSMNNELKERFSLLTTAAKNGDLSIVTKLINQGLNVNAPNEINLTPFYIAALHGHYDVSKKISEAKSFDPNIQDENGFTQLLLATINNHHDVVGMLLEKNANPNIPNNEKITPLHIAVKNSDYKSSELLLNKGADPYALDMLNNTPIYFAAVANDFMMLDLLLKSESKKNEMIESTINNILGNPEFELQITSIKHLIEYSKQRGFNNVDKLVFKLFEKSINTDSDAVNDLINWARNSGYNLNMTINETTILDLAINKNRPDVIKFILSDPGIDLLDPRNNYMMSVISNNQIDIAKTFFDYIKKYETNVNLTSLALQAIKHSKTDIAKYFIENINTENNTNVCNELFLESINHNSIPLIKSILQNEVISKHIRESNLITALEKTAKTGNIALIEILYAHTNQSKIPIDTFKLTLDTVGKQYDAFKFFMEALHKDLMINNKNIELFLPILQSVMEKNLQKEVDLVFKYLELNKLNPFNVKTLEKLIAQQIELQNDKIIKILCNFARDNSMDIDLKKLAELSVSKDKSNAFDILSNELVKRGVFIDSLTHGDTSETLFTAAIQNNRIDSIPLLIRSGSEINNLESNHDTPEISAIIVKSQNELLSRLIDHIGSVTHSDYDDEINDKYLDDIRDKIRDVENQIKKNKKYLKNNPMDKDNFDTILKSINVIKSDIDAIFKELNNEDKNHVIYSLLTKSPLKNIDAIIFFYEKEKVLMLNVLTTDHGIRSMFSERDNRNAEIILNIIQNREKTIQLKQSTASHEQPDKEIGGGSTTQLFHNLHIESLDISKPHIDNPNKASDVNRKDTQESLFSSTANIMKNPQKEFAEESIKPTTPRKR